jgi:hypothetical protein
MYIREESFSTQPGTPRYDSSELFTNIVERDPIPWFDVSLGFGLIVIKLHALTRDLRLYHTPWILV